MKLTQFAAFQHQLAKELSASSLLFFILTRVFFFKLTAAGGCKDVLINKCTHTHISDINIRTPDVQELMWKQCRNN